MKIICKSEKDTQKLAKILSAELDQGDLLCLTGDLGAGKTTLTKHIAEALGITEHVNSPSYMIVNEYENKLNHFDVYRLGSVEEMYEIGYEEYFYSDRITIIEWADKIKEIIPEEALWISIKLGHSINERIIEIDERNSKLIKKLKEEF